MRKEKLVKTGTQFGRKKEMAKHDSCCKSTKAYFTDGSRKKCSYFAILEREKYTYRVTEEIFDKFLRHFFMDRNSYGILGNDNSHKINMKKTNHN